MSPGSWPVTERADLRVLIVDDDPAIVRLLTLALAGQGFPMVRAVDTGQAGLVGAAEADVIVLDHQLPDLNGLDVLNTLRAKSARPAVVLVTAHGNESLAAQALRLGADDYLIKDASLAELIPQVLERVRRSLALRDALAAAERDLVRAERQAAIGELTVTLHHEINNPLMAASAETELLLRTAGNLTPANREALETIKGSLDRIRDTIRRAGDLRDAKKAEYLAGRIMMIDLDRPETPIAIQHGEALLFIPEEDIARVVSLLLRHAGFAVERVHAGEQLEARANRIGIRIVVISGGPTAAGVAPLAGFRPEPGHRYTLVALVHDDGGAARAAGADHVVRLPFDPGAFVDELLAVMK